MRRFIPFLFILMIGLFFSVDSYSQYENTSGKKKEGEVKKRPAPKKEKRWFAGGMLGAGFSTYSAYVEVAPIVGFKVTPAFQVGTRITYIYNSYEDVYGNRYSLHHYGGSLFGRYVIWRGLFGQAEYEMLNLDYASPQGERTWVNSFFIGGGYLQDFGGGFMSFAILFNVLDNTVYSNPIFRIGFGVGF